MNRYYPPAYNLRLPGTWLIVRVLLIASLLLLALPARPAWAKSDYAWRTLLLVYTNTALQYQDGGGQKSLNTTWSLDGYQPYIRSWQTLPGYARLYSNGEANVEQTVQTASSPLSAITDYGDHTYWISPANVADQLSALAPPGTYDSIFVIARLHDPDTGTFVPLRGRATSLGPVQQLGGATFTSIVDTNENSDPCLDNLWLEGWLAGVSQFYAANGFQMPTGGFYSAEAHGVYQDANTCWTGWIQKYMTGTISETSGGTTKNNLGITPNAWQFGTPTQQGMHQNGVATLAAYLTGLGINQSITLDPTRFRFVPGGVIFLDAALNRWELFWREPTGYFTFNYWNQGANSWLLFDPGIRNLPVDGITIDQYSSRMSSCGYVNNKLYFVSSLDQRPPGQPYFRAFSATTGHEEWLWANQPNSGYHLYRFDGNNPVLIPDDSVLTCAQRAVRIAPQTDSRFVPPGTTVKYTLVVTNTGIMSDSFNLTFGGNDWHTTVAPTSLTGMPAQASSTVTVTVQTPAMGFTTLSDSATITVTSQSDSNAIATATLTTNITLTPRLFLPVAISNLESGW